MISIFNLVCIISSVSTNNICAIKITFIAYIFYEGCQVYVFVLISSIFISDHCTLGACYTFLQFIGVNCANDKFKIFESALMLTKS